MPKPLRTRFVIADGSRARWVGRSRDADDFTTTRELAAEERLSGSPTGVVFDSGGQRYTIEQRRSAVEAHRLRFAQQVADAINAEAQDFDRLAVVAPSRVLNAIRARLSTAAGAKLAKTLAKDLTKTPDHELGTWLRPLELG
jgi:protein required for attachment to host cells